jgi:TonB family protein
MRRWILLLLACLSLSTKADEIKLIPVHMPKPLYPESLSASKITGTAKIGFTVRADGSVSDVRVIDSDHALFSEASLKAVARWKFKPWDVATGVPPQVEVASPMIFRLETGHELPLDINTALLKLTCSRLNDQVAQRNKYYPAKPLSELDIFSYVSRYISQGMMSQQLEAAERTALLNDLVDNIPHIIGRCKANPEAPYADQLPPRIQALL